MDNLKARINNVTFNVERLRSALAAENIKISIRYDTNSRVEDIRFSIVVGIYRERWLIRLYPETRSLTISGGVTKTFFGHNMWVFNNEHVQLKAIIGILVSRLSEIDGIELPYSLTIGWYESVSVERVELTNHFLLPPPLTQAEAIKRIDNMLQVLYPARRDLDGDTLDKPGTTSIGKSKSTKVFRSYDPSYKAMEWPAHISPPSWNRLTGYCANHLRIEIIMDKREIEQLGLEVVDAWQDDQKIQKYLVKKYQRFGLTVAYKSSNDELLPSHVRATNPTFEEYARHWFTNEKKGTPPDKRSGSYNRFRQYMAAKGFNINVPYERHLLLSHGLHDLLNPEARAELPDDIRSDKELFSHWWKNKD